MAVGFQLANTSGTPAYLDGFFEVEAPCGPKILKRVTIQISSQDRDSVMNQTITQEELLRRYKQEILAALINAENGIIIGWPLNDVRYQDTNIAKQVIDAL